MTCRKVLQFCWGNISCQFPAVVDDLPSYMAPSLDARQDMVVVKIPKLGKEAAAKSIKKWGQPKSKITHPISSFAPAPASTCPTPTTSSPSSSASAPLSQGCFAGGTIPRLAKDLAENNASRFLVVYSEITAVTFRGPFDTHLDSLVGQALFSDGAVAVTEGKQISGEIEPEMANTESKFLNH
ncbi:hypothetical protein RJ639_012899 [Escallonia herrerae]|uniref:Chalcone/stilbene synthase N-terminal domain-containing protein n=1 Tax=Escallonia herrerae TaxID=1293975 RepID=A0AA89APR1_9ASTE|nr:hypothetical protein RJ639_012899 [Escallonia herrerae]